MEIDFKKLIKMILIIIAFTFPAYVFFQLASLNTFSSELLKLYPNNQNLTSNLSTLYLLADALILIPAGLLLDRFLLKYIFTIALILIVVGVFVTSEVQNISFVYLGRVLMGIGHAFAFLSGFKIVRHCVSTKHRSIAMSLVVTSAMIGGFLAQTPLGYVAVKLGWHSAWLINGFVGLFILIIGVLALQCFPDQIGKDKNKHIFSHLIKSAKNTTNTLLGLTMGLLSSPLIIIGSTWGSQYLIQVSKVSVNQAELASSIIFVGTILGMAILGWLSDILQRKAQLVLGCCIISFLISILFVIFTTHIYYVNFIIFFLLAFFCGSQSLCYVLISETNSKENQNTAMAFSNVLLMLVSALLPIIFNIFSQFAVSKISDTLIYGMLVVPITLFLGIIILIMFQRKVRILTE